MAHSRSDIGWRKTTSVGIMTPKRLIKLWEREKGSSERSNFDTLVQTAADWCKPESNNIERLQAKGQKKDSRRLTDVGIKSRRMFTAGMMSNMFPQGQYWLTARVADKELMFNDAVNKAMQSVTKTFMSAIEESNFYEEVSQSVDDTGWAGTTSCYVEDDKKTKLNFRNHKYKEFYFCNNHRGKMDTYIRDFKLDARQACQEFGDDAPQRCLDSHEAGKDGDFHFIHVIMPRSDVDYASSDKAKKPWASYYVCTEDQEWMKESGFDYMPYSVWGMYRGSNNEKYYWSNAMEVAQTLSMINRMETTRMRSAERVSNPPWLAPNDGATRRISNDEGAIIYWNAANPLSKPEQLNPSDNPMVNDEMIMKKEQEIQDAFFVPLFNPLHNKQNMSATESVERLNLSMQFITPAVNNMVKYGIKPLLETSFEIMRANGHFPELDIPELSEASIEFELTGKAALAARQIELFGTMTALEQTGMMAQVKPEVMDIWNADEFGAFVQEVNAVPVKLQATEDEIKAIREQRAQQMQQQQQMQAAQVASDAYVKTQKAPEEGSGAEELMGQFGG